MAKAVSHVASAGDWPQATPAESGFTNATPDAIDKAVRDGKLGGLHGVVVFRHGRLAFERYYDGEDQNWGYPLGHVVFSETTVHDLRSVSKSIVSLLYGIALADGNVPSVDAPLISHFPDCADLAEDPARRRILVRHALTMTMGFAWDETISYADPHNSERAMEAAPDRYRYVLSQPIVSEPGTQWVYTGGSTALLARLIEIGTGQELLAFARHRLFDPIGITTAQWIRGGDDVHAAASGARMTPRDLARIGQLVLDNGVWNGRRIIAADWLAQSFVPRVKAEDLDYGYQWWLGRMRNGKPWMAGFGNGGQRLFLAPHLDLGIVIAAGNYNAPDAWKLPVAVTNLIFDGLKR